MLKSLIVGLLGAISAVGGLYANRLNAEAPEAPAQQAEGAELVQVKTEVTGIPVVSDGRVDGYLVFQLDSTVDASKLPTREFDVAPYLLDSAIRASFKSLEQGMPEISEAFIDKIKMRVRAEANIELKAEAVVSVSVAQFNYVPKADIRGKSIESPAPKKPEDGGTGH